MGGLGWSQRGVGRRNRLWEVVTALRLAEQKKKKKAFEQWSQAHGVIFGAYCAGPRFGLDDPCGSQLAQYIL